MCHHNSIKEEACPTQQSAAMLSHTVWRGTLNTQAAPLGEGPGTEQVGRSGLASGDATSPSISWTNAGTAALNCSCPLKPFVISTPKPPGISLLPVA